MMNRFDKKIAFVTGGGDGMGAASVRRLAAEGATVYAFDIDGDKANKVAAELRGQGNPVYGLQGDVREAEQVEAAFAIVEAEHNRLDVLVNVAGGSMGGYVCDLKQSDWEGLYRLNVLGTVAACRSAIALMRKGGNGGSIVIMSSISGVRGDPAWAAYNTQKAALINLAECLAWEVGADGILVNAICPGPIASERMVATLPDDSFTKAYCDAIALGRMGRPEEVAAAIAFLASDDASFITGAHLLADGGLTARTGQPIVPPQ